MALGKTTRCGSGKLGVGEGKLSRCRARLVLEELTQGCASPRLGRRGQVVCGLQRLRVTTYSPSLFPSRLESSPHRIPGCQEGWELEVPTDARNSLPCA
jgi:hypothetical protein